MRHFDEDGNFIELEPEPEPESEIEDHQMTSSHQNLMNIKYTFKKGED